MTASDMPDTRVPSSACRGCGRANDSALATEPGLAPSPGDVSVCLTCATISIFTPDLGLRPPTVAELDAMLADDRFLRVLRARERVVARTSPGEADRG